MDILFLYSVSFVLLILLGESSH